MYGELICDRCLVSLKASGGEVVAMGVSEDLKASLEGLVPSGIEIPED